MKKTLVAVVIAIFVAFSAFAAEEENVVITEKKIAAAPAEEETSWKPFVEMSVAGHSGYINEVTGEVVYRKALFSQSVMAGLDKGEKAGIYIQAENFSPSEKETRETDFYVGFYKEVFGAKLDVGATFYWVRENKANDFQAVYAEITFPSPIWGIIPFVKMEYDFSKKEEGEDMNGFMYFAGVKKEFSLHEKVKIVAEVGAGGNTGVYGLPAENIAYAREKIEISISIFEWLKLKGSAMTQQNLGRQDGIAADTDRLFVSAGVVATF
jgi:hypothetical protein